MTKSLEREMTESLEREMTESLGVGEILVAGDLPRKCTYYFRAPWSRIRLGKSEKRRVPAQKRPCFPEGKRGVGHVPLIDDTYNIVVQQY